MTRTLLALLLTACVPDSAKAPALHSHVYVTRMMYMADIAVLHPSIEDCERMKAQIQQLKDTPAVRDGLVRKVDCVRIGGI